MLNVISQTQNFSPAEAEAAECRRADEVCRQAVRGAASKLSGITTEVNSLHRWVELNVQTNPTQKQFMLKALSHIAADAQDGVKQLYATGITVVDR